MNKVHVRRTVVAVLPAVLMSALWFVNQRRPESAAHILARYSSSDAFDYAVKSHLEFKPSENDPQQTAFFATWFVHQQPELQMSVTASGQGDGGAGFSRLDFFKDPRSIYFRTVGGVVGNRTFTNSEFLKLRSSLEQFPQSSPPAQQGDLLLVSFNNGTSYETRVYDRNRVPASVLGVLQLARAPLDELKSE